MQKLKQSFRNRTERPQFINLELSTARFRLDPNEELVLFYDPVDERQEGGAALVVEIITCREGIELVVWTRETEMFFLDGRPAPVEFSE